jgi:hypothetical protein
MPSVEHRGAGGIAERELAVGAIEAKAGGSKRINIGGDGHLAAVTAEFGPEIVGDDKEDVEFAAFTGEGAGVGREQRD